MKLRLYGVFLSIKPFYRKPVIQFVKKNASFSLNETHNP
jgi:hypothetical protein